MKSRGSNALRLLASAICILAGCDDRDLPRPRPTDPGPGIPPVLLFQERQARPASVSFLPDSRHLFIGDQFGGVSLWDLLTGEKVAEAPGLDDMTGARSAVLGPDGRLVAVRSAARLAIWRIGVDHLDELQAESAGGSTAVAFHPGGRLLATAATRRLRQPGNDVDVWDVETRHRMATLDGQAGTLTALAFSRDGERLAAAFVLQDDHATASTVILWSVQEWQPIRSIRMHDLHVLGVCFDAGADTFACGYASTRAGQVCGGADVWSVRTGTRVWTSGELPNRVQRVVCAPDGMLLTTGGAGIAGALWDTRHGERVGSFEGHTDVVLGAALAPDGKCLALSSRDGTTSIWNLPSGERQRVIGSAGAAVRDVAVSGDGLCVASLTEYGIGVWDLSSGSVAARPIDASGQGDVVFAVLFSPDGQLLVGDGHLWDTTTWSYSGRLTLDDADGEPIRGLDYSRDGGFFLACSAGGPGKTTLALLDGNENGPPTTLTHDESAEFPPALSPDGRWVAAGGPEGTVRLWDTATGRWCAPVGPERGRVTCVAFSADGELFATCESWQDDDRPRCRVVVRTTRLRQTVSVVAEARGEGAVVRFSWTGDRALIVTNCDLPQTESADSCAEVWDVRTGLLLQKLSGIGRICNVQAMPEDRGWILACASGAVHLWSPTE